MTSEFMVGHLWQSSGFLLRNNSPKVRYGVWLSASLKFWCRSRCW